MFEKIAGWFGIITYIGLLVLVYGIACGLIPVYFTVDGTVHKIYIGKKE